MLGRLLLYLGVGLSLAVVAAGACTARAAVLSSPSPGPPATPSASRSPSPTPSPTPSPSPSPSPTREPTPLPTAAPPGTPAAACPSLTGGGSRTQVQLVALRVAHQPGVDRVVFEFDRSTAPGDFGIPAYRIEPASSLSGASGQPTRSDGNALTAARFQNASTRNPDGSASYSGSTDLKPSTPLVREVRLVDDFERVMVWGIGLDHLVCPNVSELASPLRVVIDLPTPP